MATLYSVDTRRHPHEGPPAQLPLHRHDGPDFISASQTKHEAPRTQWTTRRNTKIPKFCLFYYVLWDCWPTVVLHSDPCNSLEGFIADHISHNLQQ